MSTLHDKIRGVIKTAQLKLAEDSERDPKAKTKEKVKRLLDFEKKEHGHIPSVKEEEEEYESKKEAGLSDEYVEKLAAAADFLAENLEAIEEVPQGPIAKALKKMASRHPGEPAVSQAIGGTQAITHDKPAGLDAATESHNTALLPGGKIWNNLNKRPGGGGVQGQVKAAGGPGALMAAISNNPEKAKIISRVLAAGGIGAAVGAGTADEGKGGSGAVKGLIAGSAGAFAPQLAEKILEGGRAASMANVARVTAKANKAADAATKLKAIEGAAEGAAKAVSKHAADTLRGIIRSKLAQGDNPTVFHGGQPAPTPSGGGNAARSHFQSNEAAMHITPADTVVQAKKDMAKLLDEPMMSAAHDSTLRKNLRNAASSGVKIAAVKSLLRKVAAENPDRHDRALGKVAKIASQRAQENEDLATRMLSVAFNDAAGTPSLH